MQTPQKDADFDKFIQKITKSNPDIPTLSLLVQDIKRILERVIYKEIADISQEFYRVTNPSGNPEFAKILIRRIFDYIKLDNNELQRSKGVINKDNPILIFGEYRGPISYSGNHIRIDLRYFSNPITIGSLAFMLAHELSHHYLGHTDDTLDADRLASIKGYKKILYTIQFARSRAQELITDSYASAMCHGKGVPLSLIEQGLVYFGETKPENTWLSTHPTTKQRIDNIINYIPGDPTENRQDI